MKKIIVMIVSLLIVTACFGCSNLTAKNLMKGVSGTGISSTLIGNRPQNSADKTTEITDVSLEIFRRMQEGENTLISPLSIISALAMTANGAENSTLSQMEAVFGTDIGSLNEYLYTYQAELPTSDKYKVSLANSIWFKDTENLVIKEGFLQTNKDYYNSEVYKAPFDDSTKNDINAWVNKKTDGQIKELLSEKPTENSVLYLINALSFDAEWQDIYQDTSIGEGEFANKAGNKKTVDFMDSTEYGYIELPNAIGFSKPYADDQYSFVALLPDRGLAISDFINSLDGKMFMKALKNQSDEKVYVSIPKFTFEYSKELSQILKQLGIKDAFDVNLADFSSMGSSDGNIYINRVIHKTKIEVDEKGTKAGAVTAVEMLCGAAAIQDEPKIVELDRPFFFIIVDNKFHMPIFMGVLNEIMENEKNTAYTIQEPYEYPVVPGTAKWDELGDTINKVEACQIPEDILKKMSTEALVKTVLSYPLLLDILAANDPNEGFDKMTRIFNGLAELTLREDAGEYLTNEFLEAKRASLAENADGRALTEALLLEIIIRQPEFASS